MSPSAIHPSRSDALLTEIGALKSLVSDLVRETRRSQVASLPDELLDTYQKLIEKEVAERIAQALIAQVRSHLTGDRLQDREAIRRELACSLESMLPAAGPIRAAAFGEPTSIALIGPTGVGKTTTIAKLAANFCLREHRKVGLVTIDTYRIAALEQLKTYAQIIDVPLEVATTPEQLKDAVARMADRDIILIDTAGRGQRDAIKIKELRGFFSAVRPHEIHLVLSSICSEGVLTETIDRFSEIGIDRVIFTKLDEAIGFGVILSCLQRANAGLSYVTTGQDVPDDIEVGESRRLAELILGDGSGLPVSTREVVHAD
jgi:flagellar biosynthesis protein FlhF